MIYLSKGGAGADSDHTWIRPCTNDTITQSTAEQYNVKCDFSAVNLASVNKKMDSVKFLTFH